MKNTICGFVCLVLRLLCLLGSAEAFDNNAHKLLSERAVIASSFDAFLKANLQNFCGAMTRVLKDEE